MFTGYHEDKFQRQLTTDCSIIKRKGEKNAFHPGAVMVKLQLPHDAEKTSSVDGISMDFVGEFDSTVFEVKSCDLSLKNFEQPSETA